MADTRAGTHNLHVSCLDVTDISEAILVSHDAFAHVGHDLDIGMMMERKSGVRCDLLVIPHVEIPDGLVHWIAILAWCEMVLSEQPFVLGATDIIHAAMLDHFIVLRDVGVWS